MLKIKLMVLMGDKMAFINSLKLVFAIKLPTSCYFTYLVVLSGKLHPCRYLSISPPLNFYIAIEANILFLLDFHSIFKLPIVPKLYGLAKLNSYFIFTVQSRMQRYRALLEFS